MVQKAIGGNFANPLWNLRDVLSNDLSYPRLLAIPAIERSRPIGEYSLMAQHIKEYSLMYRGTELIGADKSSPVMARELGNNTGNHLVY